MPNRSDIANCRFTRQNKNELIRREKMMKTQTIFVNQMPGSDLVLFHVIGSKRSDVITTTEAVSRGVKEIRRGNQLSGPAAILNEIRMKGQRALQFDKGLTSNPIYQN